MRNYVSTLNCALNALTEYLEAGELRRDAEGGDNIYCGILEEAGALEKLKALQEDSNEAVTPSQRPGGSSHESCFVLHRHAQHRVLSPCEDKRREDFFGKWNRHLEEEIRSGRRVFISMRSR